MSTCLIRLDNYQGQYYPGSLISGRVICSFNESENIRGIMVRFEGEEHNAWSKTKSHYDRSTRRRSRKTVHYSGRNKFLYAENSLHAEGHVDPGRFEYPFTFQLPINIPATYRGRYGGIFFTLEAKVDRPFKFDYKDSLPITIVSPIDFNKIKEQLRLDPISFSDDKTLCCWCCTSGPITMEVHLEKEAFVVGEVANVKVDITNMSNKSIESVQVRLGMEVISKVTIPSRKHKSDFELLATDRDIGVGAHGEKTYNFTLEIPQSAQVPNFSLCELFSQTTKLVVEAVLPGCHSNLKIENYITMGDIPISDPLQDPGKYPPNTYPPSQGLTPGPIGFIVPQEAALGPTAPPVEDGASAPSKEEMGENAFMMGPDGSSSSEMPPPPSYNEAVAYPSKQ